MRNVLLGPFREFREDGTAAVSGQYRNGKQSGVWTYFKEDGTTEARSVTYRNGLAVEGGSEKPKAKPRPPLKRK